MTQTANDALLIFGSILIPHRAGIDLSQDLQRDGGHSYPITHNGTMLHQGHYNKWISRVSAGGCAMASPFLHIDVGTAALLSCVKPTAIYSTSATITLPAGRRGDTGYVPWATAQTLDGCIVDTAMSIVTNTATLTTVSNALQYQVHYYPKFTAFLTEVSESVQDADGFWSWSATFREQ